MFITNSLTVRDEKK